MAGSYPDVPGHRLPIDVDGTIGFNYSWNFNSTVNAYFTAQQMIDMNNESNSWDVFNWYTTYPGLGMWLLFSRPINVSGIFYSFDSPLSRYMSWSSDTTTGTNGTWTAETIQYDPVANLQGAGWRGNIQSVNWPAAKGLKINSQGSGGNATVAIGSIHIYGEYVNNGLELWHPTLSQKVDGAYFDWGDAVRGFTYTKPFRVKNNSSLTANGVVLSNSALTNPSPTITSQLMLSDGGAYATSINIGDLAPGAVSGVVTDRLIVATNAQFSAWSGRVVATATSWT